MFVLLLKHLTDTSTTEGVSMKAANSRQTVISLLPSLVSSWLLHTENVSRLRTMVSVIIMLIIHDYVISNAFCCLTNIANCVYIHMCVLMAVCKIFTCTSPFTITKTSAQDTAVSVTAQKLSMMTAVLNMKKYLHCCH